MTSTADTTQHPDVSEISDLTEGLLPPSRTADVRRHLDNCEICTDVQASLEEIRGLLGTLPGPPRMPADIAERIDAALAAEALLDATAPRTTADVSRETESAAPSDAGDRRPALTEPPKDRPAGRPRGATGPGRGSTRSRRRRLVALGAACGLALTGLGFVLLRGVTGTSDVTASSQADTAATHPASPRFSGTALPDKVRALLTPAETAPDGMSPWLQPGAQTEDSGPQRALQSPGHVPDCVAEGLGRNEKPLASEPGEYEGRAAYLVLLPRAGDAGRVDVYIMDASCTTADSAAEPANMLLRQAVTRK
ncbi:hypothetical protein BJP40_07830 [Streptomyces sp. CC53]|uniref:hypothetical protein n=1 Tax=unclassified Streptomyces TaxID=2593676 RepID=UPI0008DD9F5E|nr:MULTISPECIES: hypothetical protein [unclassified Streptomyces]OII60775.1 hypothetical protein BJP40_07830 [Streptomyces sp. CC53]